MTDQDVLAKEIIDVVLEHCRPYATCGNPDAPNAECEIDVENFDVLVKKIGGML